MPTVKITVRSLESTAPPASGRLELFDEDLPGFCIRITPNDRRTACVMYRHGRRVRRATLGTLPPLTLADARDLAQKALRAAALGGDPAAAKRQAREAITLAGLVAKYVDAGEHDRSPATTGDYRRTLRAAIQPSFVGGFAAAQVVRGDLRMFLEDIAKRTPIRANRVLALIRAAYRWGLREELVDRDPTTALRRLRPERPRERVLSDAEVKKLWESLSSSPAVVAAAVKLLLLLGTRRNETLNMRWADVDELAHTWTVPGRFRKGGRTHVVPLSPLALAVLAELRPVTGNGEWVLAGHRGASLANNPDRWFRVIRNTSALDFTLHDLRRTCATGCARLGAAESTVSRILGHKAIAGTIAVSGIYDRFDRLPAIRAALTDWSDYVEALLRGDGQRGEVVAFSRASG